MLQRANRHHTPNSQPGAAQPTQDEDPQATSNLLKVSFVISHGKAQEPLINHREVAKNNHQFLPTLLRCSKPSRRQQTPSVTRKPQQIDPQVPLDAITQVNAFGTTKSHFDLPYQARR